MFQTGNTDPIPIGKIPTAVLRVADFFATLLTKLRSGSNILFSTDNTAETLTITSLGGGSGGATGAGGNSLVQYRDTCTYWAPDGLNNHGQATFAEPVLLQCKWEQSSGLTYITSKGEEAVASSKVFVSQEVELEGYLAQGDQSAFTNPRDAGAEADEIVSVKRSTSNVTGKETIFALLK